MKEILSTKNSITLEVCSGSYESAVAAYEGGADRIELCSALSLGGLTPSIGDIERSVELPIEVNVLIRPRGGDYCYSSSEVESMILDITHCRRSGVDGVVIGALTRDGDIDKDACARMIEAACGMSITFHRAFDVAANMFVAMEDVISLGADRILTSGGMPTAYEGRYQIKQLTERAADRISIMPGSGVSNLNAAEIVRVCQCHEIHASCKKDVASLLKNENPHLPLDNHLLTDRDSVSLLRNTLNLIG